MAQLKGFEPGGSIKKLKAGLKKSDGSFIKNVPSEGITVRIAEEPDKWARYMEHFNEAEKISVPCSMDCEECASNPGRKPSKRVLMNAVDVTENRLIPLKLPVTAARLLMKFYDKYGTILDRDYEISKEGSGFDTTYFVSPESKGPMNLSRFTPLDLEEVLNQSLNRALGIEDESDDDDDPDDDTDTDERPMRRAGKKAPMKKAPPAKKAARRMPAKKVPMKQAAKKKAPPKRKSL